MTIASVRNKQQREQRVLHKLIEADLWDRMAEKYRDRHDDASVQLLTERAARYRHRAEQMAEDLGVIFSDVQMTYTNVKEHWHKAIDTATLENYTLGDLARIVQMRRFTPDRSSAALELDARLIHAHHFLVDYGVLSMLQRYKWTK